MLWPYETTYRLIGAERTAILLGFVGDRVLFCQFITDLWNSSTSEGVSSLLKSLPIVRKAIPEEYDMAIVSALLTMLSVVARRWFSKGFRKRRNCSCRKGWATRWRTHSPTPGPGSKRWDDFFSVRLSRTRTIDWLTVVRSEPSVGGDWFDLLPYLVFRWNWIL